jgi:hypothetical protein
MERDGRLTIVLTRDLDAPNARLLTMHAAEYDLPLTGDNPTTLCRRPLTANNYRYAPPQQTDTVYLCLLCRTNATGRRIAYLGKPVKRQKPESMKHYMSSYHDKIDHPLFNKQSANDLHNASPTYRYDTVNLDDGIGAFQLVYWAFSANPHY